MEGRVSFEVLILNNVFTNELKVYEGEKNMFLRHHVSQQLLDDHSGIKAVEMACLLWGEASFKICTLPRKFILTPKPTG